MIMLTTPGKINMEPKNNGGLEDEFPFQSGDFYVPAVKFQGWIQSDFCIFF